MSWGLSYTAEVYLSRQYADKDIHQIQDIIEGIETDIQNIQIEINMFASANPKDITPKNWEEEPIRWINKEVDRLIDDLHEYVVCKYQLEMYKKYLENDKD